MLLNNVKTSFVVWPDGTRIAYDVTGKGSAIVLLHGGWHTRKKWHDVGYVGQSYLAFARVWEHLRNGFKGHSIVGRFIWCNWPASMKFTIELLSSQLEQVGMARNDLNAAECATTTQAKSQSTDP